MTHHHHLARGPQALDVAAAGFEVALVERQASIGRLAAGVAHEINNPLSFVASNLSAAGNYLGEMAPLLEAVQELTPEERDPAQRVQVIAGLAGSLQLDFLLQDFRELLADAKNGAARVASIVQDLKDFSRVDCAEREPLDLGNSLRTAARLAESRLPEGVRLEVEAAAGVTVIGSGGNIHQALWNLLENALWAAGRGGTCVRLSCGREDTMVWLQVSDDGPGISAESMPMIFDPFYTTREVGEGAGLGLTVVQDVARAHGGRVDVVSANGEGATLRMLFPAAEADQT